MIKMGFVFLFVLLFSLSAILSVIVINHSDIIIENENKISKLEERIKRMEKEIQQLRKEDDLK